MKEGRVKEKKKGVCEISRRREDEKRAFGHSGITVRCGERATGIQRRQRRHFDSITSFLFAVKKIK